MHYTIINNLVTTISSLSPLQPCLTAVSYTHLKTIETFRRVRDEQDRPAAILLDTKGPEIRLGDFENGSEILEEGDEFTLTSEECPGTKERVSTTYKALPSQVSLGTSILIDDGRVRLRVAAVSYTHLDVYKRQLPWASLRWKVL